MKVNVLKLSIKLMQKIIKNSELTSTNDKFCYCPFPKTYQKSKFAHSNHILCFKKKNWMHTTETSVRRGCREQILEIFYRNLFVLQQNCPISSSPCHLSSTWSEKTKKDQFFPLEINTKHLIIPSHWDKISCWLQDRSKACGERSCWPWE